jgi:uncharacterized protein YfiM (DUF2279 family)
MNRIINGKTGNLTLAVISLMILLLASLTVAEEIPKPDSFTGRDKLEHFAVSAIITSATGFVLHNHFKTNRNDAIVIGFTTSFGLGGIKELIDRKIPGEQSSWKDLVADFAGCAAGALILAKATK